MAAGLAYENLCKTCDLRVKPFWPQSYDFKQFGRNLFGDAIYQISRLKAKWFHTRRVLCFPYISLCKSCDPLGEAILPQRHTLNILGNRLVDDVTCQLSRL